MKFCVFRNRETQEPPKLGLVLSSGILEVAVVASDVNGVPTSRTSFDPFSQKTWETLAEHLPGLRDALRLRMPELQERTVPLDAVQMLPPIPQPRKVLGIIGNYRDFLEKTGAPEPKCPVVFTKWASTLIGSEETVRIPSSVSEVTYEGELAVVVGKPGKHISAEHALDHVLGYTIMNDVTALDVRKQDGFVERGKNMDTFGPIGPFLVTSDEVADPQNLSIRAVIDGVTRQHSTTRHMIFSVAELLAFVSEYTTLEPGDIIATGTPAGVAAHHTPPAYLQPGMTVEVEIDGLGRLRNPIGR